MSDLFGNHIVGFPTTISIEKYSGSPVQSPGNKCQDLEN